MAYPLIDLETPVVVTQIVVASQARVISTEEVPGQSVRVKFTLGESPDEYITEVFNQESYYADWTDDDVIAAIEAFVSSQFSPNLSLTTQRRL